VRNNIKIQPLHLIFMAIQFKMVPKQNNIASPPEVKYYPCAISQGEVNLNDLAKIVASRCTISRADCHGVIMALSEVIGQQLVQGNIVRLDELGTFSLTLQGTAADSPEPLGKANIKGARIVFQPSRDIKIFLKSIVYKRIRE
jgi:predicted histone-like DNA-binding protein